MHMFVSCGPLRVKPERCLVFSLFFFFFILFLNSRLPPSPLLLFSGGGVGGRGGGGGVDGRCGRLTRHAPKQQLFHVIERFSVCLCGKWG